MKFVKKVHFPSVPGNTWALLNPRFWALLPCNNVSFTSAYLLLINCLKEHVVMLFQSHKIHFKTEKRTKT